MMTGGVVPEPVFTPADYQRVILGRLYAELAPLDPDRVLRHEWANARGCIARFDRGSIEIRVMDVQECPAADLAIVALIVEVVRALVDETWIPYREQKRIATEPLYRLLVDTTRWAENARVDDAALLAVYGCDDGVDNAGGVWRRLLERVLPSHPEHSDRLRRLIDNGSLATRILRLVGPRPTHEALERVYRELADCLARGSELGAR
jgi:gamma-glutamyl:cysteine ligase YbdK (ATP-grasp superfamily)